MITRCPFQFVKQQVHGTVLDIIRQLQLHARHLNLQQMLAQLDLAILSPAIQHHHAACLLYTATGANILNVQMDLEQELELRLKIF
jgi:hypothetical protein